MYYSASPYNKVYADPENAAIHKLSDTCPSVFLWRILCAGAVADRLGGEPCKPVHSNPSTFLSQRCGAMRFWNEEGPLTLLRFFFFFMTCVGEGVISQLLCLKTKTYVSYQLVKSLIDS